MAPVCRCRCWVAALVLCAAATPALAQPRTPQERLLLTVKQLHAAKPGADPNADIEDRVRHVTWLLFVGELASENGLDLSSGAIDAIQDGLRKFEDLEQKLKADPQLERKLAANSLLTMRMDAARQRRPQAEAKEKLSRAQETERLRQLRELNTLYREMTQQITAMNTQFLVHDYPGVRKTSEAVTANIKKTREVASRRRDYYLFEEEPTLDTDALKLVTKVTDPIVNDMVAHFQSLQAMMAYRLALVDPQKPDKPLLEEAERLASDVLKVPESSNLLAHYVQGMSRRELGMLLTAADPLDARTHQAAAPHYDAARKSLAEAVKRLDKEPSTGKMMVEELKLRQAQLQDVKPFLDEADRLSLAGRPERAQEVLAEAMKLHRSDRALIARVDVEMRAGLDLGPVRTLVKRAAEEKLLKDDEPSNLLLQGRVELTEAWDRMSRQGVEKMSAKDRADLDAQIKVARGYLERAASKSEGKPLQPTAQAYVALSYAYGTVLDPKGETDQARGAYEKLPAAARELQKQVEAAPPLEQISLREALVAARMAQGYLAVRLEKPYRDEAMAAFAAAADVQAKLPFTRSTLKLFGSPYVAALLSRPEGEAIKIAQEERQLREMLAHFAEGAVALQLGKPEVAARQMAQALAEIQTGSGPAPVDPDELLKKRDADARTAMINRTRSLAVLTLVAGKQHDRALVAALKPQMPDVTPEQLASLEPEKISKAAEAVSDPLAGYALALAIEEHASATYDPKTPRSRELFKAATDRQRLTKKQLDETALFRERYPQLPDLNAQALERLTDPKVYLERAAQLRREFRLGEATQVLDDGAKRHPTSQLLIAELIYTRIDEAALNPDGTDRPLKAALALAEQAQKDRLLTGSRSFLALGELYERLAQLPQAQGAYQKAVDAGPTDEERLKAQSRLAVLSARIEK